MRFMLFIPAILSVGCRPQTPPQPTTLPLRAEPAVATVDQALARLHDLRVQRDYRTLADLIDPDVADDVVELVRAVDRLLDANAEVQTLAAENFGTNSGQPWDLSIMGNNLGALSLDVRLVRQERGPDEATLTIQEGGLLPLVAERFVWRAGRWLYAPQPPDKELADDLSRLAGEMRHIAARLKSRSLNIDEMDAAFQERAVPIIHGIDQRVDGRRGP